MDETFQKIDSLKEHFRNSDPTTLQQLDSLEKSLKRNSLLANLADHDGVKMIIDSCNKLIDTYSTLLEEQKAEDLTNPAEQIKRVRWEAYRYQLAWFVSIFTISKSRVETKEKRVDAIAKSI